MAKTANATHGKRTKVELVITAAINTALALGIVTPPETVDISSIIKSISGGGLTRQVDKEYVTGDSTPILSYDTDKLYEDIVINFLYTNGKDTLTSVNIDIGDFLDDLAAYVTSDLPLQVIWSVAGGAVGDEERISSATETYIVGLNQPVGGVGDNAKVQRTLTLSTSEITKATVA